MTDNIDAATRWGRAAEKHATPVYLTEDDQHYWKGRRTWQTCLTPVQREMVDFLKQTGSKIRRRILYDRPFDTVAVIELTAKEAAVVRLQFPEDMNSPAPHVFNIQIIKYKSDVDLEAQIKALKP